MNDSSTVAGAASRPLVVAIEMGYGHLRAAQPLADVLGTSVLHVDRSPLASPEEQKPWASLRKGYESICRVSQVPVVGAPMRRLLDDATSIPHLFPYRDLSTPTFAARLLEHMIRKRDLGRGLVQTLRRTRQPLLTTFFTPALIADHHGYDPVFCVVTDSDINRIWVPIDGRASRITYLAPTQRVVRRLRAYGVASDRIRLTGFPLPAELLGSPRLEILERNLAARLVRLDPNRVFQEAYGNEIERFLGPLPVGESSNSPLITFAVGGAGAQVDIARHFLPSFRRAIRNGQVRLALVAGVRSEIADRFHQWIHDNGLDEFAGGGVRVVYEQELSDYFRVFHALLGETDVLWTKPSEMTFFAALGIPMVLSPPVGVHEQYNGRWVIEHGAALEQRDPRSAAEHFAEWLSDGTLANTAWSGFKLLPKSGLYRILEEVGFPQSPGS